MITGLVAGLVICAGLSMLTGTRMGLLAVSWAVEGL